MILGGGEFVVPVRAPRPRRSTTRHDHFQSAPRRWSPGAGGVSASGLRSRDGQRLCLHVHVGRTGGVRLRPNRQRRTNTPRRQGHFSAPGVDLGAGRPSGLVCHQKHAASQILAPTMPPDRKLVRQALPPAADCDPGRDGLQRMTNTWRDYASCAMPSFRSIGAARRSRASSSNACRCAFEASCLVVNVTSVACAGRP